MIILSTAYFPNIQYTSKLISGQEVFIEAFENFQKQSYRNRCEILSANGKLSLFVPVEKGKDQKTSIKDVRIDYQTEWQKQHLKSIESAYSSSPFYEYIIDDFLFVYNQKEKYLFDLNLKILEQIKDYLQIDKEILLTIDYNEDRGENDYRNIIHPKSKMQKQDDSFTSKPYYQTFGDKFDFIPNLSIIDLLFNEGPRAKEIINRCINKNLPTIK